MPQRAAAFEVLKSVLEQRQPLDEAFSRSTRDLSVRDRAFVRALTALALRHKPEIDCVIAACLERPLPANAKAVHHVLSIGVTQALYMETAPHAVAATAVELVRALGFTRYSGLVNAVLRRVLREPDKFAAVRAKAWWPAWLVEPWTEAYGAETAAAILAAIAEEPPLDITVKDKAETALWAERLGAEVLPTGTLRLRASGAVEDLPGLAEGAWWVQDAGAALPALLLGDVNDLRVADICAAPGGKTLQLAARGARVTAVDRSAARLERLRENLARTGLEAEVIAADAASWQPEEPFDAVLLDAPCSATGTLRRHPDVAWTKTAADVFKLGKTQAALLKDVARLVKPGGVLVYCICSLQPDEESASPAHPPEGFVAEPIAATEIGGWDFAVRADGALRTLPCHLGDSGGIDGFYAARFRRVG
jgi:16S rRNA (cytosine967-C5)-methyltransferase